MKVISPLLWLVQQEKQNGYNTGALSKAKMANYMSFCQILNKSLVCEIPTINSAHHYSSLN